MPSLKPITNGCVLKPDQRYMINIETGVIYPFDNYMAELKWMREYVPKFNIVEAQNDESEVVKQIIPNEGDIEQDVNIVDSPIDIPADKLTPAQKRKITIANKKG